jgi:hypothetical protein
MIPSLPGAGRVAEYRLNVHNNSEGDRNVGETALPYTGRLCPRERPMRNFANEGHSAVTETAQGFKGDGAESVTRKIVVPEVFVQLFLFPAMGSATGLLVGAMHIAGSERVDEGDIPKNVTGARPDVAVEVPASPGTVGGARASAHVGACAAGGKT